MDPEYFRDLLVRRDRRRDSVTLRTHCVDWTVARTGRVSHADARSRPSASMLVPETPYCVEDAAKQSV